MKVSISRFDPQTQKSWVQDYEVDTEGRSMTVMDVVQQISDGQDPSLAYYRHSMCNHGICGRCLMQINGKAGLACIARVSSDSPLRLAPLAGHKVVRDLVVETAGPLDSRSVQKDPVTGRMDTGKH